MGQDFVGAESRSATDDLDHQKSPFAETAQHVPGARRKVRKEQMEAERRRPALGDPGECGLEEGAAGGGGVALALPFEDGAFDAAYTQHVAMNIADKPVLYAEIARVLKPGAVFGIYDVMQGAGGEAIYPTPWANDTSTSFLATPDEMRCLLETAGFRIERERDTTAAGRAFFESVLARIAESGPPPLGLHLRLPDFRPRAQNMLRGLTEDRLAVVEIVCRKA